MKHILLFLAFLISNHSANAQKYYMLLREDSCDNNTWVPRERELYTYNDSGQISVLEQQEAYYDSSAWATRVINKFYYNPDGTMSEMNGIDNDGEVYYRSIFTYD